MKLNRLDRIEDIDRDSMNSGRMNTLQLIWLAYTLTYCIIAGRRNTGALLSYIYISDTVMIVMTAIALIFSVGVLIYNHKYESYPSVKKFGYFLAGCNAYGFILFLLRLTF